MFEELTKFSKILVTGPQRSGTTICAKMIATDTKYMFLSQAYLEGVDPVSNLQSIVRKKTNIVVQCPGESYLIEQFSANDVLIVFMIRDIKDIIDSERRHHWTGEQIYDLYNISNKSIPVSQVKYDYWPVQRIKILHWSEIRYESLSLHPLFVPREQRKKWGIRQIDKADKFRAEIFIHE